MSVMAAADKLVEVTENHMTYLIHRFEDEVGFRPLKVAAWSLASAAVLGAAAAGLGAVAAGAGTYVAIKAARRTRARDRDDAQAEFAG